jgi:Right handed beta helix region
VNRRDAAKVLLSAGAASAASQAAAQATKAGAAGPGQTLAESAAGVTPQVTIFSASPRIDPRRYGAIGDGVRDDTTAMQTALRVAQAGNGRVSLPEDFNMLCGPLSLTLTGSAVTHALAIEGASMQSRITVKGGTNSPLLTLTSADPKRVLTEAQCILENFSLYNPIVQGRRAGGHGLEVAGLGLNRISGVMFLGFDVGLKLSSSLTMLIDQQCQFHSNNTGIGIVRAGSDSNCNLITVDHCRIIGNTSHGVDFSGGSQFVMRGCDLEQNGTAGDIDSGAFRSGADLADEIGLARIELYENWFEANSGRCIDIREVRSGPLQVGIEGGQIISSEQGRALRIAGADGVLIKNVYSPSPGDRWEIGCRYLTLINTLVHTLNDAGVTFKDYHNARTGTYTGGGMSRGDSFMATAEGLRERSATGRCIYTLNGSQCTLTIPAISGASNSSGFSLSGLPAEARPAQAQNCAVFVVNGGVQQPGLVMVDPRGTLAFRSAQPSGAFLDDGSVKGTPGITITYNLI